MQQTERTRGLFIAVDGPNGAGKSTVITALAKSLTDQGHDVVLTREPGGTPIGEKIRALILDPESSEMHTRTELLLFAAARAQHYAEKIEPALSAGKMVISDRFSAATVSFQGYAQGLDLSLIAAANQLAIGDFKPDMNLILDLDTAIGRERVKERAGELDRHELQALSFQEKSRQGYLDQAHADPENFCLVDASQSREAVLADALAAVQALVDQRQTTKPRFLRFQEST